MSLCVKFLLIFKLYVRYTNETRLHEIIPVSKVNHISTDRYILPNDGNGYYKPPKLSSSLIYPLHALNEKTVVNQICHGCCKKASHVNMNKEVSECKRCGLYLHGSCVEFDRSKICIPINKLFLKPTGKRTLNLKDLCSQRKYPMVPSVLLSLMNHIQTSGIVSKDMYRDVKAEKNVKGKNGFKI